MAFRAANTRPIAGTVGWKILYMSTTATGKPVAVSGSVLVPPSKLDASKRPIVGFGTGSQGMADRCAPSNQLETSAEADLDSINALLGRGDAVAVADYEGFGTPGVSTNSVTLSEGHAVIDIVRAARQLTAAALPTDGPIGLWGYSQGGGALGSAAENAATYAPELHFAGAAAGGVLSDPRGLFSYLNGTVFSGVLFSALIGYDAAYPAINLQSHLTMAGKFAYQAMINACSEGLGIMIAQPLKFYVKDNPLQWAQLLGPLAANKLGNKKPTIPMYLYHGQVDEILPYRADIDLRMHWCKLGGDVRYRELPFTDHVMGELLGRQAALGWLQRQMSGGQHDPGNCPG